MTVRKEQERERQREKERQRERDRERERERDRDRERERESFKVRYCLECDSILSTVFKTFVFPKNVGQHV